jgi:FlaA1/EpsC-like NDP-sugar epimerase
MTYFSIPDLLQLIWATGGSSAVMLLPRLLNFHDLVLPRGVLLTDFMLTLGGLCVARLGTRLYRERISMGRKTPAAGPQQRIVIVGAGDAGATLAKEFINAPSRGFKPVFFLDDDVSKHGKLVHGVPVLGPPEAIATSRELSTLSKAVIAMPSASAKRVREVVLLLSAQGLKVETLPAIEELASGRVRASRIRPVEVQDLLGRDAVNLDSAGIRGLVTGKVVMVTGAGGSIGAELCRQIAALNPKRLLMVEQAEGSLFLIEQELNESALGALAVPLVADILDAGRMEHIFARYRPEIVFHAAAHKHVFMMERQPAEAVRNNVLGTRHLARLAAAHGVAAFVLISTDKAINPTSVMGATKRLAEIQLMNLMAGNGHRTKFMAVRFGNVLGSSGSVIPIFKNQIAKGGPVTVTHPDVTRYFMTIPEAVGLVLQSSVLGKGGEIFVLDMGDPVKITDLARQMIELSGYRVGEDIEIKFTGLKPGEKLFEELQHHDEQHTPTEHPRIMRFTSRAAAGVGDLGELESRLHQIEGNELKRLIQRLVPEYTPFLD